jgi:hypothetical protein
MKIKLIIELEKKNNNLHYILRRKKYYINKFKCIKVLKYNVDNIIQLKNGYLASF